MRRTNLLRVARKIYEWEAGEALIADVEYLLDDREHKLSFVLFRGGITDVRGTKLPEISANDAILAVNLAVAMRR